jgi:hydrogenase nickel incorporation protein HypA/HybF
MHELSVCQALLEQVRNTAQGHHAEAVGMITVRIGPLSGVEPDLLKQAFTIARNGPMTSMATLDIELMPVRVRCRDCDKESEVRPNRLLCTECSSYRVDLISGDEMLLARVELHGAKSSQIPSDPERKSSHV